MCVRVTRKVGRRGGDRDAAGVTPISAKLARNLPSPVDGWAGVRNSTQFAPVKDPFPQPQPGTANTTRASLTRRLSNLPDALKSVKKRHGVSRLLPNAGTFASGVRSRERSGVCQFLLENFGSGGTSRAISDSLNSQVRVLGRRTDCIPGLVPTLHAIFGCGCHGKSRRSPSLATASRSCEALGVDRSPITCRTRAHIPRYPRAHTVK